MSVGKRQVQLLEVEHFFLAFLRGKSDSSHIWRQTDLKRETSTTKCGVALALKFMMDAKIARNSSP